MASARHTAILLVVLLLASPASPSQAKQDGKWDAASGCTCHSNTGSSPTPTHNFPSAYNPEQNYTLNIGMSGGVSGTKGGFNLEISHGTLSTGVGIGSVQVNSAGNQATHTWSDYRSWSVIWQAPANGSGQVTFELAVLSANGNGQNSGDAWGTTTHNSLQSGTNTPPDATDVAFSPSEPTKATGLMVIYTYADADGDAESGTEIRWKKNGNSWTMVDDMASVPVEYFNRGEQWEVEVKPKDGTDFGDPVSIGPVTIGNSKPIASNLEVVPETPTENDDLILDYDYYDHDGDPESASTTIQWYLDEVRQTSLDGQSTVPNVAVRPGDTWQAAVTPHDGEEPGETAWSASIVIGSSNSPPTVSVQITPGQGATSANALSAIVSASDPDGQEITSTQIVWKRDGSQVSAYNDETVVPPSATAKGEVWLVEARASDGIVWSSWSSSQELTIQNTPPTIVSVTMLPEGDLSTMDELRVEWVQTDLDGDDELNSQVTWWVNDEWVTDYDGLTTIPASETVRDQRWAVEVRPGDGEDLGVAAKTPERTILNGGPSTPVIDLGPWATGWTGPTAEMPTVDGGAQQDSLHDLYVHAGSDDIDGEFLTFDITWVRNGFRVSDLDGLDAVPADRLEPGQEWTVTIAANDPWGLSSNASASITIVNLNPEASWSTSPEPPLPGAMVTFDASTSSDPDGAVTTWLWAIDGIELSGQSVEVPLGGGDHVVRLTVIDDMGGSNSAQSTLSFGSVESVESLEASLEGTQVSLDWTWSGSPAEFRVYRSTSPITSVVGLTAMDEAPAWGEPVPVAMEPVGVTDENHWSEPVPAATTLYYAITSYSNGQEIVLVSSGANTVSINATGAASAVDGTPTGSAPIFSIPIAVLLTLMGVASITLSMTPRGKRR